MDSSLKAKSIPRTQISRGKCSQGRYKTTQRTKSPSHYKVINHSAAQNREPHVRGGGAGGGPQAIHQSPGNVQGERRSVEHSSTSERVYAPLTTRSIPC